MSASHNGGTGIELTAYSSMADCVAEYNGGSGFHVYSLGSAINCVSRYNGTTSDHAGFQVLNSGNHLINCQSVGNAGPGYSLAAENTAENCIANDNQGSGFIVQDSELARCAANDNAGHGFAATYGHVVMTSCKASGNAYSGFALGTGCVVRDSVATKHMAASEAGFTVAGTGCRLTGNHAYNNARGFYVYSNLNAFLAMNTATGNSVAAFVVNAGNDTGAVISNPGSGFASTNPFANVAP